MGACGNGSSTTSAGNAKLGANTTETRPTVALHLDVGDYSTTDRTVALSGATTPGARVTINDHSAQVHGSRWHRTVRLDIGSNDIEAHATMAGHVDSNELITITRHHTQVELETKARERRERKEAEERRRREAVEAEERDYKEKASTIPFSQLNKDTERYDGEIVTYTGQIFQIHEEGGEGGWMLVSVTNDGYGFWSDEVYVSFAGHVQGAEKDTVTFWGKVTGTKEYETKIGGNNEVPEIEAKYVEG
jgi:hypothetical protein